MSLPALNAFCRVLERASFRQAADSLNIPIATVSSQIKSLEARLGTRLLIRSSRRVEPTDEGLAYYRRIAPLLQSLSEADEMLKDTQARPRGRLHVSVPASLARLVVAPALPEFLSRYPDISLRITATDRIADISNEGLDCAVRAATPLDDGLMVKALSRLPQFFAASPAFIAQHGVPQTLEDLITQPFINYAGKRDGTRAAMQAYAGREVRHFLVDAPLSVDDGCAYVALGAAGLGVIQSPLYDLLPELDAGRLQVLLPQWQGPDLPYHISYATGRCTLPRMQVFVQWMSQLLGQRKFHLPDVVADSRV